MFPAETQGMLEKLKGMIIDPFFDAEATLQQDNVPSDTKKKA